MLLNLYYHFIQLKCHISHKHYFTIISIKQLKINLFRQDQLIIRVKNILNFYRLIRKQSKLEHSNH